MSPLVLSQEHVNILTQITPIINGRVDLFVKSTFKRRRWFDTYICIWYGCENDCNDSELYYYGYNETPANSCETRSPEFSRYPTASRPDIFAIQEPRHYVKKMVYELEYDQTYHQLSDNEIEDLLL